MPTGHKTKVFGDHQHAERKEGCKVCFDPNLIEDESPLDICVAWCKQERLTNVGVACGDVTRVNNNTDVHALIAEDNSCINGGESGIGQKSQKLVHSDEFGINMHVELNSSLSVDIANGQASGTATTRYGNVSLVESNGQVYLREMILAVTDLNIAGESFSKGQLELLEAVPINEGFFFIPMGTEVGIRGYDSDNDLVTAKFTVSSQLSGFLDIQNEDFELSGTLSSSTTEASIEIDINLIGKFDDMDGDGVADVNDNCPDIANASQQNSSGSVYGNACSTDRVLSMDHPQDWSSTSTTLSTAVPGVQGGSGLLVEGAGYMPIQSTLFSSISARRNLSTVEGPLILQVFVKVPSDHPNPYWVGDVQAYISSPSAQLNNVYLGIVSLTDFPVGSYWPARFQLPTEVITALADDHGDLSITFAFNTNQGAPNFVLDNASFEQGLGLPLSPENAFACPPVDPSEPSGCSAGMVLNFEGLSDWTANAGSIGMVPTASSGFSALSYTGGGYAEIQSRKLGSAELKEVLPAAGPGTLLLDVMPTDNQPNPSWVGAVQVYLQVPDLNMQNVYLGQVELTGLPQGIFSTVSMSVSETIMSALNEGVYFDARFKIVVNVPQAAPALVLDNIRF